jgi:CheY-like chemotaxis protein
MAAERILVVDDDRNVRETLGDILRLSGYTVTLAENGARALDEIRGGAAPAVVLLDLMMPVMSGWEFLEVAEADDHLRILPILVVSALPAPVAAAGGGVRGWLGKPVDIDRLLAAVSALIGANVHPGGIPADTPP